MLVSPLIFERHSGFDLLDFVYNDGKWRYEVSTLAHCDFWWSLPWEQLGAALLYWENNSIKKKDVGESSLLDKNKYHVFTSDAESNKLY